MKSAIKVGTLIGIPIEINYSWAIVFGLVTWSLAVGYFPVYNPFMPEAQYWIAAIVSSLLLFVSLLLHELSHSYVAMRNNITIKKITLFIFGGVAQMEKEPDTSKVEFKIAIAGPVCSLMIAVVSFGAKQAFSFSYINPLVPSVLNYLAVVNAGIVVFNSMPGFPLDGGRVLRAVLWRLNNNLRSSTKIAAFFGKIFSFVLMFLGLLFLFLRDFVSGIWFIVLGLFLHEAAELSYQQLVLKGALVGVPVRDVMATDLVTVGPDLKLDRLVNDFFFKHRHVGFPVVENGTLKGLVMIQNLKNTPKDEWCERSVKDVMVQVRDDLLIPPDTDSLEALLHVAKSGLGRLLIVENGKLLGLVTQRNLMKLFEIKANLYI